MRKINFSSDTLSTFADSQCSQTVCSHVLTTGNMAKVFFIFVGSRIQFLANNKFKGSTVVRVNFAVMSAVLNYIISGKTALNHLTTSLWLVRHL